eukprot:EG_transcript_19069
MDAVDDSRQFYPVGSPREAIFLEGIHDGQQTRGVDWDDEVLETGAEADPSKGSHLRSRARQLHEMLLELEGQARETKRLRKRGDALKSRNEQLEDENAALSARLAAALDRERTQLQRWAQCRAEFSTAVEMVEEVMRCRGGQVERLQGTMENLLPRFLAGIQHASLGEHHSADRIQSQLFTPDISVDGHLIQNATPGPGPGKGSPGDTEHLLRHLAVTTEQNAALASELDALQRKLEQCGRDAADFRRSVSRGGRQTPGAAGPPEAAPQTDDE